MKLKLYWYLFISVVLLSGCKYLVNMPEEEAVATVDGKYLYRSELVEAIPDGVLPADSIEIARQYIDNWIRQQVLLKHAQNNLSKDRMDFSKQLENYKNSLIIFEYESELIRQKLDTVVRMKEIETFYQENEDNFQLRENIVRYSYVKIPLGYEKTPQAKKARQYLLSSSPGDIDKLIDLCDKSTMQCRPDNENWVAFNDLIKDIPIQIYDQENFLKNRTFHETNDSLYTYILRINDYKIRESISPMSLQINNIRNMILNRRKQELINRMQKEVYEAALQNNEFEIY